MEKFTYIKEQAQAVLPELVTLRRDLHKHAETGWLDRRTSSLVARRLKDLG